MKKFGIIAGIVVLASAIAAAVAFLLLRKTDMIDYDFDDFDDLDDFDDEVI